MIMEILRQNSRSLSFARDFSLLIFIFAVSFGVILRDTFDFWEA